MSARQSSALAALLAVSIALPTPRPARRSDGAPAAPVILPLAKERGHHRTIRVRIGADTADFILDTGGGTTLVDSALAAKMGCHRIPPAVGFRMTGERVGGPRCAHFALGLGPLELHDDVGTLDVARLVGDSTHRIRGILALSAFAGRTLTLDLPHDRLVVETERSAALRTAAMRPVPMRLATGQDGASLCVFVALSVRGAADPLWLEWDSGHGATTFLSPGALAFVGADSTARATELRATFDGRDTLLLPVQRKNVIYDGVLSAAAIERATWTVDLARGRMWIGTFEPFPAVPTVAADVRPPAADPAGIYEFTVTVGTRDEPGVVVIRREGTTLTGQLRATGEDDVVPLTGIAMRGDTLRFTIQLRRPMETQLVFTGTRGVGTWTGPEHSGPASAEKRS